MIEQVCVQEILPPEVPEPGAFCCGRNNWQMARFLRQGGMPYAESRTHPDTEVSHKKYGETTIGDLRKTCGAEFAEGCTDNEKIADVLRKLPSLRKVIREREARRVVAL